MTVQIIIKIIVLLVTTCDKLHSYYTPCLVYSTVNEVDRVLRPKLNLVEIDTSE